MRNMKKSFRGVVMLGLEKDCAAVKADACRSLAGAFLILFSLFITSCTPEDKAWTQAQKENTVASYEQYIKQSPQSQYRVEAERRIEELLTITVEGKLNIGMVFGGVVNGTANLTPMLTLNTGNATYKVKTSENTQFVNLEKQGDNVLYQMSDAARYRIVGKLLPEPNQTGNNTIHILAAKKVELLRNNK